MMLKKLLLVLIVVSGLVNANILCAADDETQHLQKQNALAVKLAAHMFSASDFTDRYKIDEGDLTDLAWEFAYERKTSEDNLTSVELSLGHSLDASAASKRGVPELGNRTIQTELSSYYFIPTIKYDYILEPTNTFSLYTGIGPDFYFINADHICAGNGYSDHFFSLGLHWLAGVEYYFMKRPALRTGEEFYNRKIFDAPVALILEYKYSWVPITDYDESLSSGLNTDFNAGGHTLALGIKWHY